MARPKKEGMDYFPHDTDAVNDKKIEALRMLYGNDGYAFYFIILEMIYKEPAFELDVSDAETIQILARKISISEEKFNQILQTAIKRECFDSESYLEYGILTSNGIKKRANIVVEKREKMREYHKNKASEKEGVSDAETTPESTQSKVKESKRKVKEKILIDKYPDDSPYFKMSVYFYGKICEWTDKVSMPDFQKWADDFRKISELDKREKADIRNVIDWVTKDSFWQANILSPSKLRVQFEKLQVQMERPQRQQFAVHKGGQARKPPIQGITAANVTQAPRMSPEEMEAARAMARKLDEKFQNPSTRKDGVHDQEMRA